MKIQCENCKSTFDSKPNIEDRCPFCLWLNPSIKTNYDLIKQLTFNQLTELLHQISNHSCIDNEIDRYYCQDCEETQIDHQGEFDCTNCTKGIWNASSKELIKIYLSTIVKQKG